MGSDCRRKERGSVFSWFSEVRSGSCLWQVNSAVWFLYWSQTNILYACWSEEELLNIMSHSSPAVRMKQSVWYWETRRSQRTGNFVWKSLDTPAGGLWYVAISTSISHKMSTVVDNVTKIITVEIINENSKNIWISCV